MLRVTHPAGSFAERDYVLSVVLRDFLGLDFHSEVRESRCIEISLDGDPDGRALVCPEVFLCAAECGGSGPRDLPSLPLPRLSREQLPCRPTAMAEPLPVLFGMPDPHTGRPLPGRRWLPVDVFGSAFFMLTRYEELLDRSRDQHGRASSEQAVAWKGGFLERPIIDEYVEVLWGCLSELWPQLVRRKHRFRPFLTHDVDRPLKSDQSVRRIVRSAGADIWRRRDAALAVRRLRAGVEARFGRFDSDPCNSFDFIMDVSERHGRQSEFYFIAGHTAGELDGTYSLQDPWIRALLRRIHERGHLVGLHPSYGSLGDRDQLAREFFALRSACEEEGITQTRWGGRQHYLRWSPSTTWRDWAAVGLDYDSTVGFADRPGFRCGTSREYRVFDVEQRRPLALLERPLACMDQTLLAKSNMGLSLTAALELAVALSREARAVAGDFTILWHNDRLLSAQEKHHYAKMIDAICG